LERTLHHRWNDLDSDSPMEGVVRKRVIGEQMMLSEVRLAAGTMVPTHEHPNEQMAIVTEGVVRFMLGEGDGAEQVDVAAGGVLHLPGGLPHSAEALEDAVVLDAFSPPSEETGIDG
jgi:quercetin dioxygenase-like cupin family protein